MLTRSPVPARSSNASPSSFHASSFHYAPVASPHQSPRVSTALSRRPSTASSPKSVAMTTPPPQPRQKKYVAVDAATQYSPMEPMDYAAKPRPSTSTTPMKTPDEPPPTPGPKPMALTNERLEDQPTDAAPPIAEVPRILKAAAPPFSPNKRRNSQGPGGPDGPSSVVGQGTEALSKRPKPSAAPPKVLPQKYELCPVEDMVVLISNMLAELIETNDALALKNGHLTRFHSRTAPGISVLDYLHRLAKHATLTPPLLLSMVYYIDRLCALYPDFTINTLTVHRFLITAATVAAKGLSDSFWNNSTYARVGGVRVAELKLLELEFLYRVDWKIVPNPEVLVAYYRGLVERSPAYALQGEEGVQAENGEEESEEVDDEGEADDEDEDEDTSEEERPSKGEEPANG